MDKRLLAAPFPASASIGATPRNTSIQVGGRLRLSALAGAGVLALLAGGSAQAQTPTQAAVAQPAAGPVSTTDPTASADDLGPDGFYFEADEVIDDDKAKIITAHGAVEARYRGRVLRAANLVYDLNSKVITARGDVAIINSDGSTQFSDSVVLDDQFRAGVALGFSTRLQNNAKLAAASVVHRSESINELNKAIYTSCDTCTTDGKVKQPTWSISAEKVVQDRDRQTIYYHNAVIRVKGIPILYSPVFWHADPSAGAQSGFLAPRLSFSNRRGFSLETPYLISISKSQDLVLAPLFSTKINPLLNGEWRKVFNNGQVDARFGYTYEKQFDNNGKALPGSDETSRSYILASGAFDFASKWTWGFSAERISDPLFFDRYEIPDVYEKRGLYETDTRRLLSQLYVVRQDQSSYASAAVLDFQGIQPNPLDPSQPEPTGAIPIVAPLLEGRWALKPPAIGGQLILSGSAVALFRAESPVDATLPGVDSRRVTAEAEWRRALGLPMGMRLEPFADARFDAYDVSDLDETDTHQTTTRAIGTLGATLTWPFIRQGANSTVILEPVVQAAISPDPIVKGAIPNDDSVDLVFDETNLFDTNRAPGFDVYDAGARLNTGGRATVFWGEGREARLLVGRSFRDQTNPLIPAYSGYRTPDSDWVVAASASPMRGISLYGRTLLDNDTLAPQRTEFGANFAMKRVEGYVRYLNDKTDALGGRQNLEAGANLYATRHWGLVVGGTRDLKTDEWTRSDIGLIYRDECTRFELVYHHEAASVRLGGPSDSIQVRLVLATLADPGYRDYSGRW